MSKMYDILNKEKMDNNKKNIIVFLLDQTIKKDIYSVTYQYIFNTIKILSKDFNIIIVTKNIGSQWFKYIENNEEFMRYSYIIFDKEKKYIKSNTEQMPQPERVKYILDTFREMEQNEKWLFDNLAGTISSQFIVPALDVNYEIISDNEKLIKKRDKAIQKFQRAIKRHKIVSHCAFIHKPIGFPIEFMFYLMEQYKDSWHYGFCHDTGSTWIQWMPEQNPITKNVKCFYFIDDNRSVREFKKYPLTELQDFYGKKLPTQEEYNNIINNKSIDFLFGGLFPFEIDYRKNAWYTFFQDLDVNGIIRTQTNGKPVVVEKNGLLNMEQQKLPKKYQDKVEISTFINDILNHKMVKDTVPYNEYNGQLKDSLFTIVLRCYYGKYDSLNFRVINSLYFGTIPLIDESYDYDDLQIPTNLKKKIVVKNSEDIKEKIEYYKNHMEEYRQLFFELFNHFIDKNSFEEGFYEDQFKNNYFKEIY